MNYLKIGLACILIPAGMFAIMIHIAIFRGILDMMDFYGHPVWMAYLALAAYLMFVIGMAVLHHSFRTSRGKSPTPPPIPER